MTRIIQIALLGALAGCAGHATRLPAVPAVITQQVPVPVACTATADASDLRRSEALLPQAKGAPIEAQNAIFRSVIAAMLAYLHQQLEPAAQACGVTVRE